jgi:hypothetical protein
LCSLCVAGGIPKLAFDLLLGGTMTTTLGEEWDLEAAIRHVSTKGGVLPYMPPSPLRPSQDLVCVSFFLEFPHANNAATHTENNNENTAQVIVEKDVLVEAWNVNVKKDLLV